MSNELRIAVAPNAELTFPFSVANRKARASVLFRIELTDGSATERNYPSLAFDDPVPTEDVAAVFGADSGNPNGAKAVTITVSGFDSEYACEGLQQISSGLRYAMFRDTKTGGEVVVFVVELS